MVTKICTKCNKEKPLGEFHKAKKGKCGRSAVCKQCKHDYSMTHRQQKVEYDRKRYWEKCVEIKARVKAYREANPELVRSRKRESYMRCREKHLQRMRRWRERKGISVRESWRLWEEANPERARFSRVARTHRYRARKRKAISRISPQNIQSTLTHGCLFCGATKDLVLAHDIPLSEGGPTTVANTFCLCRSCNGKMGTDSLSDVLEQKKLLERGIGYDTG